MIFQLSAFPPRSALHRKKNVCPPRSVVLTKDGAFKWSLGPKAFHLRELSSVLHAIRKLPPNVWADVRRD